MKNIRQLVELNHVDDDIRKVFENEYEDDLRSSDNYFRYYPNDDTYDKTEGNTEKINKWLVDNGYEILDEQYFHILVRWDW